MGAIIENILLLSVLLVGIVVFLAVSVFCANIGLHYFKQRRDAVRPRRPINK